MSRVFCSFKPRSTFIVLIHLGTLLPLVVLEHCREYSLCKLLLKASLKNISGPDISLSRQNIVFNYIHEFIVQPMSIFKKKCNDIIFCDACS